MPLIIVYNLNVIDLQQRNIERIEREITRAFIDVPELKLSADDLMFTFPKDPSVVSAKIPVVIIVELLFDKPERTTEVRQRLAQRIAEAFRQPFGNEKRKVAVAIKGFDSKKNGFFIAS